MAKEKACRDCGMIYEQDVCPNCGSSDSTDTFKGKIVVINPEKSEIAPKLKIKKPGKYGIKTR